MAKNRKSIMSLVHDYMSEGAGAESTILLDKITNPSSFAYSSPDSLQTGNLPITLQPSLSKETSIAVADQKQSVTPPVLNNQTNNQTNGQTDIQSIKQAQEQTINHANRQPSSQSSNVSSSQVNNQLVKQSHQQSLEQSIKQSFKQSNKQSKYIWLPLNENQGKVLFFLYEVGLGLTNMEIICEYTSIPYGTARSAVDVLIKEGYILNKARHNGHSFKGFEYTLNNHLCSLYISRVKEEQSTEQSHQQSPRQQLNQTNNQTVNQSNIYSSSKVFEDKNLTTTKTQGFLHEPELRFWAGEGVTEKQIQNWMDEFQLSLDEITLSLRYGRFDILERGDIQNSANWFYKILTRNGFYPKPQNYKSLAEIKAEALLQQQERDREANARLEAADFESRFQKFISDPSSPQYQELFSKVSEFAKEMLKTGDKTAVNIELKELFKR